MIEIYSFIHYIYIQFTVIINFFKLNKILNKEYYINSSINLKNHDSSTTTFLRLHFLNNMATITTNKKRLKFGNSFF